MTHNLIIYGGTGRGKTHYINQRVLPKYELVIDLSRRPSRAENRDRHLYVVSFEKYSSDSQECRPSESVSYELNILLENLRNDITSFSELKKCLVIEDIQFTREFGESIARLNESFGLDVVVATQSMESDCLFLPRGFFNEVMISTINFAPEILLPSIVDYLSTDLYNPSISYDRNDYKFIRFSVNAYKVIATKKSKDAEVLEETSENEDVKWLYMAEKHEIIGCE